MASWRQQRTKWVIQYDLELRKKTELVEKKARHFLPAFINRTDIVVILNTAWEKSFVLWYKNQNAIADRRWNPLNQNILCLPEVLGTMTKKDLEREKL